MSMVPRPIVVSGSLVEFFKLHDQHAHSFDV